MIEHPLGNKRVEMINGKRCVVEVTEIIEQQGYTIIKETVTEEEEK